MAITVGIFWATIYFFLALAALVGALVWLASKVSNRESPVGPLAILVVGAVFAWLWFYAATHFRVPINSRALLINTIDQKVVGVREAGVQPRPLVGVRVMEWPANTQYQVFSDMGPGIQSATTKNGTAIYADTTVYLDLSGMDIEAAFKASNGSWDLFWEKNLRPGLMGVARNVAKTYATHEHTFLRQEWEVEFERQLGEYLGTPSQGFGIGLVSGRTVMQWDFVNPADATAYDNANRAGYLVQQRENEKAALEIEKQMSVIRSEILSNSATGSVSGLEKIQAFFAAADPELRPYLMAYLQTQVDLEYLRLVAEQKPGQFLPPGSGALPTFNTNVPAATAPPPAPTGTVAPGQ